MEKSQATRFGVLVFLAFALLMAGSYFMSTNQGSESMQVTFPSGARLHVEIADSDRPLMLITGLAFRDALPLDWGMLFIFERSDFHKRNTRQYRFPVDIIWLDDAKRVVLIMEDAKPCLEQTCPEYGPPREKARYVIETHAGFARREALAPGAELRFTLRL
jgi:uncharacterized membrane protein (UPF0127 family)